MEAKWQRRELVFHIMMSSVRIDALAPAHYGFVVDMLTGDDIGARWRQHLADHSPASVVENLWTGVLDQRVILSTSQSHNSSVGVPIGLAVAYDANLRNGTAMVGVVAVERARRTGAAFAGLALFIEHLFLQWPLRQLGAEAHEFNYRDFSSGEDSIFEVVGRLHEYSFLFGEYWDLILLRITRERWHGYAQHRLDHYRTVRRL